MKESGQSQLRHLLSLCVLESQNKKSIDRTGGRNIWRNVCWKEEQETSAEEKEADNMEAQKTRLVLLLVAGAAVGVVKGERRQCWEHLSCQELNTESSVKDGVQICESTLNRMPLLPGAPHHQPSPSSEPLSLFSIPSPQTRRSYSMEHFRWGKPIGRKRRPVKIYGGNSVEEEEESSEMRRRELPRESNGLQNKEELQKLQEDGHDDDDDDDGTYKMKHFRWGAPPASKRYGGFMRSWDEHSQRPLITLLKTVINKEGEVQKREQ
ncbi:pro-opiomelanocortin-like [Oryzias latipes]|uniref:Uncharacterized protein n=1 Tax=Oryzias latipes TaxID=8090 RepID=A0A3B3IEF3_ORYLA|nr:pro-opiomelanocortin-like [Oryzias latipes]